MIVSLDAMAESVTQPVDDPAEQAYRIARQHHLGGRLADAEGAYRSALEANPGHAGAMYGLGTLALQADEHAAAEQLIAGSIAIRGDTAEAWYHLGIAQQGQSHLDSAIVSYRRATAIDPRLYEAQYQLAICLQLSGELEKSLAAYEHAFEIKFDDAIALTNYAVALRGARKRDAAVAVLRRAVAINSELAEAWLQLGSALRDDFEQDARKPLEAIEALRRASALVPGNAKFAGALAAAFFDDGQLSDAIEVQRRVVSMAPADAEAHCALAEMLLARGDWREGYAEYEYRWKRTALPWPRRRLAAPMWDGGDLEGRVIYLHAEQSIGDAIQFIRYLPEVAARRGRMIVEIQPTLRQLFQDRFEDVHWISPGDALPACDVACPLLSLPYVLKWTAATEEASASYLSAPAALASAWRSRLRGDDRTLLVGLAWAGSPSMPKDFARSLALSQLAPLAEIPNVRFVSLQKGWASGQGRQSPFPLIDVADDLHDFSETAAATMSLDLIISVDTAVAHLAGALGKPVWAILPKPAHWRWGVDGESSEWYPTMTLFRQKARGQWDDVLRDVVGRLEALAGECGNP